MKMVCKFLSDPELVQSAEGDLQVEIDSSNRSSSMRVVEVPKRASNKIVEHKMTCFFGVLNGTGVGNFIASGRFGSVWIGNQMDSSEKVAVKEFHDPFHELLESADDVSTRIHELVYIRHPHIVEIFNVSKCRNICYCVMELAHKNVQDEILERGKYTENKARVTMSQVISALQFLHEKKIVHGNLHIKNILVFGNEVKISDVATGMMLQWLPYSRIPSDLLQFYAPELVYGLADITKESDLWGLGVCLFVMTTGDVPFNGDSRACLEKSIQYGIFRAPFTLTSELREILKNLIKVAPYERLTLEHFKENKWFEMKDPEPVQTEKGNGPTVEADTKSADGEESSKGREHGDCKDRDQMDVTTNLQPSENPPSKNGGNESSGGDGSGGNGADDDNNESGISTGSLIPKRYYKQFSMIIEENVREEWDPDVFRVEKVLHQGFGRQQDCYRVIMPFKPSSPKPSPSVMSRVQNTFTQKCIPNNDQVIDFSYTDYAPMSFGRYSTGMVNRDDWPAFTCTKEARRYYCREEGRRVWNNLNVTVCMRCRRAGTDALRHSEENCLYKLVSDAVECNERVFFSNDDQFNVRSFTLVYRTDGGRAPAIIRLSRGTMRLMRQGVQRIRNVFNRRRNETTDE